MGLSENGVLRFFLVVCDSFPDWNNHLDPLGVFPVFWKPQMNLGNPQGLYHPWTGTDLSRNLGAVQR